MASFCTKCGIVLTPDNDFCPMCGAPATAMPIETAAQPMTPPAAYAAPAATPYQQVPSVSGYPPVGGPAPYAQPVAAAPASGGGSALKIILIIVAVFVGLGIIGAGIFGFAIWRVSRAVHIDSNSGKVSVQTANGSFSANSGETYTAAELGTDIYPGAKGEQGGMRFDLPTGSMVTAIFTTPDSKEKVISFYKEKLGSEVASMDSGDTAVLTAKKSDQEAVVITIDASARHSDGLTKITVSHTKSNKAN